MLAAALFAGLVAVRNPGVRDLLLGSPGLLDGESALLWVSYGLWPLVLAAGLWAASWGLGRRALRALRAVPDGGLDETCAAALGLGLLGQAVFFLGWAGRLNPAALGVLAAAAAVLGWTALPRLRASFRFPHGVVAGLLAFAFFHCLIVSLAPPTEWDVRAYHLALPELYLKLGKLDEIPWLIHSHWPHLMEVLYALPLAAGRDGAAALLHAGACALLAFGVFRAAGGGAAGWVAALVLAGQPALLRGAPLAHADGTCALLLFAAAAALARWEEKKGEGRLLAAGLLAGFAVAAKLFGAAGAVSWTVYLAWKTRRAREPLLFAAAAAAAAGPWFVRTWLNAGDPVWPLLGLTRETAELAARYEASNFWSWPPPAWLLTHRGPAFLLLPLAGLAWLGRGVKPAPRAERLIWLTVPVLAALAFRHHEAWRFLMPAYAAAASACGRFAAAAFASGGRRRLAAGAVIAFAAAPIAGLTQNNELFAVLGVRSQRAPSADRRALFEERSVDAAAFHSEAREFLPPGARVLLVREIRGYRAGYDYLWGDPVNQTELDWSRFDGPEALVARLKELGVTHVYDHHGSSLYGAGSYYGPRTLALLDALQRRSRLVLARPGFALRQLL